MKGIYAAGVSIFNDDMLLDVGATLKHAENLIEKGCHGVVVLGSTGQAQLISIKEKFQLIESLSYSKQKKNFIVGTGNNSLIETINLMKHAQKNGLNNFLLMPPAYYKYGDEGVYAYFSKIIDRLPEAKIILYNFEKLNSYVFSIQIIERLVKNFPKQIIGVKDSTYNLFETLKIPNFSIFPGSEIKLLKGLELGCCGIISAICNVTSHLARAVYDDFQNQKKQTSNEKLCAIRKIFDNYNLISGLHSFLSYEDKKYKRVLPPLCLLTKTQEKELIFKLKELDFFPEKNIAA